MTNARKTRASSVPPAESPNLEADLGNAVRAIVPLQPIFLAGEALIDAFATWRLRQHADAILAIVKTAQAFERTINPERLTIAEMRAGILVNYPPCNVLAVNLCAATETFFAIMAKVNLEGIVGLKDAESFHADIPIQNLTGVGPIVEKFAHALAIAHRGYSRAKITEAIAAPSPTPSTDTPPPVAEAPNRFEGLREFSKQLPAKQRAFLEHVVDASIRNDKVGLKHSDLPILFEDPHLDAKQFAHNRHRDINKALAKRKSEWRLQQTGSHTILRKNPRVARG